MSDVPQNPAFRNSNRMVACKMRILGVSLLLTILSVGFVMTMDWLVGVPLSASISNIWQPFKLMMNGELATGVLFVILMIGYTANVHKKSKR
jgi:hypothetical protein